MPPNAQLRCSAAPATPNEPEVLQVLHLPHKTSLKLLPSAAPAEQNEPGGAPSAVPATQNEAAPKVIKRRRTSAELYEGHQNPTAIQTRYG